VARSRDPRLISANATLPVADPPPTRYVSGGGVHLAFQTYGTGRMDVLLLTGFVSHVERLWEEPRCRVFLSGLARTGRLILLDRRGVGLSDRVGFTPSVDATAQDIGTVLDAVGSRRVVLLGGSEGGPACIKFAADHPDRVAGLILFGSLAKGSAAPDYPHALQVGQYDLWLKQLVAGWGGPAGIETFAPSLLTILRREPGGPACFVLRRARAPSRVCSRPCATRMCGIFCAKFPFRRWCSTGGATAPFA
jgi:pimeloyl-ACP methyl ester carboxylesterase